MRLLRTLSLLALSLVFTVSCRSSSEFGSEAEQLVDRSRVTFQGMMSDNQYPGLVDMAARAKAIIIVPSQLRFAFFVGGRGGNAVMLVRDEQGMWSQPAFYTLGGLSFGLQFGGQSSEIVITVMTERGVNAIMNRRMTLGGDAGLAMGELGKGVNAATGLGIKSDLYSFARSEGLYAGVSLEGAWIEPRTAWNHNLYGAGATPRSILIERASTSQAAPVDALVKVMP